MDVSSPLGLDTNVVVVGERVTIRVSESLEQREGYDDVLTHGGCPLTATSNPSTDVEIVEVSNDEITPDSDVIWENMRAVPERHCQNRADFLVTFLPHEALQYKLEVKSRGRHIPGSPFSILAISCAEEKSEESPKVVAGEPVTFALPKSWNCRAVSPTVSVGGPQGECEIFNRSGNNSFSFFPNQPGAYYISIHSKESSSEEEKYCITAKTNDMGAKKCYVVESDKYLFQKPIRFTTGCGVSFRVHTNEAFGTSLLRVIARGPSGADVTITESKVGEENVIFQPSSPGRYSLDILWSGEHIQDSPLTLHFRKPRSRVESSGLDLAKEVLIIDTPFRFKLSCKDSEEDIQINCEPSSAALINVTPALSNPNMYLCEIIPRQCGAHLMSVQLHGMHIPGSPFPVQFRPRGDPLQCQLETALKKVQNDPTLKFYVDTEGAGEGRLTAVAIDEVTRERMVATVTPLDGGRYMVEFTPGRGLECKLGVLYDGQHIPGSPFPLLFPGAASFTVEGDGLIRTRVNQWSQFEIHSINAGHGELSVSIEGPNGINVAPVITTMSSSLFNVCYLPNAEGHYLLFVRWGQHQIPGSPFKVECVSDEPLSHFTIWRPSKRIPYGSPIEFTVEDGRTEREKLREKESLCVEAKAQHTSKVLTALTSKDSDGNIYCQFQPPKPGTYTVMVKYGGMELLGSPFRVTVPSPPRAERVRVWGKGLQDHQLGLHAHGSKFMVDATDAGSGILVIKVCKRRHL